MSSNVIINETLVAGAWTAITLPLGVFNLRVQARGSNQLTYRYANNRDATWTIKAGTVADITNKLKDANEFEVMCAVTETVEIEATTIPKLR